MSEAARVLRLVVPGALFLMLYSLWFFLDSILIGRRLPGVSPGGAALAGGATIPLGFVAQMIAAEITWIECPRWLRWLGRRRWIRWLGGRRWVRWLGGRRWWRRLARLRWYPLRTIDNRGVVREVYGTDCRSKTDVQLVSVVDFHIHRAYGNDENPHGLWRLRALTDMYQGLGHGAVATGMALLAMLATAPATARWFGNDPVDLSRGFLLGIFVAACGLLFWWMYVSHQRVVTIAQEMVVETLREQKKNDDALAARRSQERALKLRKRVRRPRQPRQRR